MAEITQTRQLPAEFIEALGKTYADQLSRVAGTPIDTAAFAPRVAAQDPLQTQAAQLAASGVGSFQPFLTAAEQAATQAGTTLAGVPAAITAADLRLANVPAAITAAQQGLTAAGTELTGAGTTLGGAQPFITQAAGLTGPTAFRDFLSPFQQDVIDTTLTEFDRQAAARQAQQSAAALGVPGAFGGGREGVLQAEFQAGSDRNRAALQAQLLQQGFEQAQQLAGQDFTRRLGLAQAQSGLAGQQAALAQQRAGLAGQQLGIGGAEQSLAQSALGIGQAQQNLAQQQLGTGQFQTGLASLVPQLQRADINQLGTVGGAQQAFAQAQLDAAAAAAREAAFEPVQRTGFFGAGVTGLMGGYPGQIQFQTTPSPSPLQTALGAGATFAGIYGGLGGKFPKIFG
jgi:hypothetical protein